MREEMREHLIGCSLIYANVFDVINEITTAYNLARGFEMREIEIKSL